MTVPEVNSFPSSEARASVDLDFRIDAWLDLFQQTWISSDLSNSKSVAVLYKYVHGEI